MSDLFVRKRLEDAIDVTIDRWYIGEIKDCARHLASTLSADEVRSLARLAYQAQSVADIIDFLKFRVGKYPAKWSPNGVGRDLVAALSNLRSDAEEIARNLARELAEKGLNPAQEPAIQIIDVQHIHLLFCRKLIERLVVEITYLRSR